MERILIIGCGNTLLADEGIGVHFIKELEKESLPNNVKLLDGGTGGLELIPYIREADKVIIIDAIKGGGAIGDIYKFKPHDYTQKDCEIGSFTLHDISLKDVFLTMEQLEVKADITIFGVEPKEIKVKLELSDTIRQVIPKLKKIILKEINALTHSM